MKEIFILSCANSADGGGVYKFALSDEGKLKKTAYLPCDKPMYAAKDGGRLHILLRVPFAESENGGYFSCNTNFSDLSEIKNTLGKCACHLAVGKDVYIANYLSGNLVKNCKKAVFHTGKGVNPSRQEGSHTHFAGFSPDKNYVLCCDLGLDAVFIYDGNLNMVSRTNVPQGYGVRHLTFSKDGKYFYAVNELIPSVSVFAYEGGKAEIIKTYPLDCKVGGSTAAIKLDESGKKLYVSVRGEDAVFVLAVQGEKLSVFGKFSSCGKSPRDIGLFGDYCMCANEGSDTVTVIDIKNGYKQTDCAILKNPLCVL